MPTERKLSSTNTTTCQVTLSGNTHSSSHSAAAARPSQSRKAPGTRVSAAIRARAMQPQTIRSVRMASALCLAGAFQAQAFPGQLGDAAQAADDAAGFHRHHHELLVGRLRQGLRSEEHTSELQSRENLVCRLLLEKKNKE